MGIIQLSIDSRGPKAPIVYVNPFSITRGPSVPGYKLLIHEISQARPGQARPGQGRAGHEGMPIQMEKTIRISIQMGNPSQMSIQMENPIQMDWDYYK